jgi:hypothetical protein
MKKLAPQRDEEIVAPDILFRTRFGSSSVVVRRVAFDECGYFDTTLRSSEDRHMWLRIAAKHRIYLLGERLAVVRRHPTSMSRNADRMKQNTGRVLRYACEYRIVSRAQIVLWLKVYSFFFFQTAWTYADQGRRWKALHELAKSVMLWPWFANPQEFNEPALYRVRSLVQFLQGKPRAGRPNEVSAPALNPSALKEA